MERSFRSRCPDVDVDQDFVNDARSGAEPEQRLLVAIVRRAVWDFVLYRGITAGPKSTKEDLKKIVWAETAAEWLFWDGKEKDDGQGHYSFMYICDVLDIDPAKFREHALKMTREDIDSLNNKIKMEE